MLSLAVRKIARCRPWWLVAALAGIASVPLATHSDGLARQPLALQLPVPRALLHADGDGDRIFDDLEARWEAGDAEAPTPVVILFEAPLEQVDITGLTRLVGDFPITRELPGEAALAARLTPAQARVLAMLPIVTHIEGDDPVSVNREMAEPAFGVTQARADFRLTGDGDGAPDGYTAADHTIAIVDTGIDGGHADFAGGKIIGWADFVNGRQDPYDDFGHGTHVASIAAGRVRNGVGGVAPGAALVGVKVIGGDGNARPSDVARGIDWCVTNRDRFGIRIVNLSMAGTGSGDGTDVMSRAIQRCVNSGIVVCVAAGNNGPATYSIPAPGASAAAITVGTMRDPGRGGFALWTTSGRGPTADGRVKPDLVAPGFQILAARAGTTTENTVLTGSSMATPFVAGVCALMLTANPGLTPPQIKAALRRTAVDFGPQGEDVDYGAGRLDAYAAIRSVQKAATRGAGTGPAVPDHRAMSGRLVPSGHQEWRIQVTDTHDPIAAVLIASDWTALAPSRYQLQLRDSQGALLATASQDRRAQIMSFQPLTPGTYTLQVDALAGQGPYFLDVSCDLSQPRAAGH
jgi:serine protease AprX